MFESGSAAESRFLTQIRAADLELMVARCPIAFTSLLCCIVAVSSWRSWSGSEVILNAISLLLVMLEASRYYNANVGLELNVRLYCLNTCRNVWADGS